MVSFFGGLLISVGFVCWSWTRYKAGSWVKWAGVTCTNGQRKVPERVCCHSSSAEREAVIFFFIFFLFIYLIFM
jgi:hypothetical protein